MASKVIQKNIFKVIDTAATNVSLIPLLNISRRTTWLEESEVGTQKI